MRDRMTDIPKPLEPMIGEAAAVLSGKPPMRNIKIMVDGQQCGLDVPDTGPLSPDEIEQLRQTIRAQKAGKS